MKIIYWLCLFGLLFSCSDKKTTAEGGVLNPDRIPGGLQKEKPIGQKLTGAQMDRLRNLLQKTPLLPDSMLFLPTQDESVSQKSLRQVKIDGLPSATKNVYQNILTNCTPDNKKAGGGEFAKGKVQAFNYNDTVGGGNCPVDVKRERYHAINWAQVEMVAGLPRATGTAEASHRTIYSVNSGDLAKGSTISKIISRSASRGAVKMENGKTTNYVLSQGARSVVIAGEGPVNATFQSQLLEVTESSRFIREEIIDLKIVVKTFDFQLYYYVKNVDGGIAEETMYINGEVVVAEDFAEFLKGHY